MRFLARHFISSACLFVSLLAPPPGPGAWAAEIQIESPSFTFDSENRVYRYQEAKIRFQDVTLEALEVLVFADTSEVKAAGQVRVRDQSLFISADRADFNADTGIGTVYNARLYDSKTGYYFTAAAVRRVGSGSYEGERCELTACPAFVPGWKISAGQIHYDVDNFATGTNARLELGEVPVFWFPVLAWPTVQKRSSGFLQPSYSNWLSSLDRFYLGSRLQVPYFWAIGPDHDLTVTPEWIERRGYGYELDYRYAFTAEQAGRIKLWGIQEQFPRQAAQENDILEPGEAARQDRFPRRYILEWSHNQPIGDAGRVVGSLVNSSDGQVWREYRRIENYRPDFSYQAALTNQADWGDVGLTAEHASEFRFESIYANSASFADGDDRPALRPRLSYQGAVRPWEAWPLTVQWSSFTAHFIDRNAVSGQATLARPTLVVPLSFGPGLEMRASLARSFVSYDGLYRLGSNAEEPPHHQGYAQSQAFLELRADIARIYPQENGQLQAVKHRITPRLILDAVQDVEQPLADRVVRAQVARELVTLRLDNAWLGQAYRPAAASGAAEAKPDPAADPWMSASRPSAPRVIGPPVAELGQLNIIQRYNLLLQDKDYQPVGPEISSPRQETSAGEPLLPLIVEGAMQLGPVSLQAEVHFHHQLRRVTESAISMRGSRGANSYLSISYSQNEFAYRTPDDVLRPGGTTFGFDGQVPFADQASFGFSGVLNLSSAPAPLNRRLQKGLVFFDFHPICYSIRLSYEESLEVTQEGGVDRYFVNRRVFLSFDLASLFSARQERVVSTGLGQ